MKSSVMCVLLIIFFQACIFQTALALPSRSTSNDFDNWLATFDPNTPHLKASPLCDGKPDGFYPFAGECTELYFACVGGNQYDQKCSSGYVYDPSIGNCVDPATAPCKVTTTPIPTSPPTTATTLFQCATDGFYPLGACSQNYYACIGGDIYPQLCPGNGVFDPSKGSCVSPDSLAACQTTTSTTTQSTTTTTTTTTTTPTTTTTTPTTTTPTTTTPTTTTITSTATTPFTCTADGFYSMGACLNTYYSCVGGVLYIKTCPGNGIFVGTQCVGPDKAPECATTTTPLATSPTITTTPSTTPASTTTTTSSTTPASTTTITTTAPITTTTVGTFTCPAADGFYPIPGKCTADYYVCVNGAPYIQTCPAGIFDPVLSKCIAPESASAPCTATTTTTPATTTTTTPTTTTIPTTTTPVPTTTLAPFVCPANGQYPYPGSCTLYYVCGGGTYVVASCPIGEVFNPDTQFCEAPGNVPGCTAFSFIEYYQGMRSVGQKGGQPNEI